MHFENFLMGALDDVLEWGVPDAVCGHACRNLAESMAGGIAEPSGLTLGH